MRELVELDFLKLMLTENAAGVFSSGAGFGAEAGGPRRDVDGKFFFGNVFVTIEIVQFYFGSGREPEISIFDLEKVSAEFWQLAGAGERGGVHKEGRQDFGVAVLTGVHVEKEIREGALEASSPAFINGEAGARDFRGGGEVENAGTLADFPVWLGSEIEFRRRAPAADFFIVSCACADGNGRVRNIRDGKEEFALRGVQLSDEFVGLLDAF